MDMIRAGCVMVSISDRLRRSLARVADEVQVHLTVALF